MMEISSTRKFSMSYLSVFFIILCPNIVLGSPSPLFPSMFVFGDSLVDNGNNNFLASLAKANYRPYGIDFSGGPTGRFCNGKTIIDFLGIQLLFGFCGDMLGLPYIPAFANTSRGGSFILKGVNYASAAAGILDETGRNLGARVSFSQQVHNFETTVSQLRKLMNEKSLAQYLAKSLAFLNLGSNDYLNNYLMPALYTSSSRYNPQSYSNLLVDYYTKQILALHGLGLRKFFLAGIGPLGCTPYQRGTGLAPPGKCVSFVNNMVELFNAGLKSMVSQLNANHSASGATFVFGNAFGAFNDIVNNSSAYGFRVTDRGCCEAGEIICLPLSIPCSNREAYVFWDPFHPTQAMNQLLAIRAFSGPLSDCYPMNVQQMSNR